MALALILLASLAPALPPQEPAPWTERRGEARELVDARDLAADLHSGAVTRELLWELLDAFGPTVEDDPLSARVVLAASRALKEGVAEERRARLYLLLTRAVIASGELQASKDQVFVAGRELRQGGLWREPRDLLDRAQRALPEQDPWRYYFLQELIDIARIKEEFDLAFELAAEAEGSLAADARADLRPFLWLLRAQIYRGLGLPDMAAPLVERALAEARRLRALEEARAPEEPEVVFLGALLAAYTARADQRLASGRYDRLIEETHEALADFESLREHFADDPRLDKIGQEHPVLLTRLGMGLVEKSVVEPALAGEARSTLHAALAAPQVSAGDTLTCELRLGYLGLLGEDLTEAERWIAAAGERDFAPYGPDKLGWLHALEARLALSSGADRAQLELHRVHLSNDVTSMLRNVSERALRPGGQAYLHYGHVRFVVGELLSLSMLLDPGEEGELAALEVLYRFGLADTLVRRLGGSEATFQETRSALLGAESGALIYLPGKDRSHVFALDAGGVDHDSLPGEWSLIDAVGELALARLRASKGAGAEALERGAGELGELLLPGNVRARVEGWSSVTIVGAELLGDPPFELLPFGRSSLGEELAVSYLSSLALGTILLERAETSAGEVRPDALCLAGDALIAEEHTGLERLPLEGEPAQHLLRPFDDPVDLLLREDATLESLTDGRLGEVRLLHLFTHGLRDPGRERSSGLLLSPAGGHSGGLWCDQVETLEVPPVVVLSACGSARGPARAGSGFASHLGGAFLFAGARAVVLSEADLRYGPTLAFAEVLHEELAAGASVAEAARRARVRLAASDLPGARLHASRIRVVGLGSERPFDVSAQPEGRPRWPWALAGGALVLALALAARRYARRAA